MIRHLIRHIVALTVLLAVAGTGAAADERDYLSEGLKPHPTLSPKEVVRIQLEALRRNDASDRGIAVAFRFASPTNRVQTGPLPRFASMVRNGPYALMLNYVQAIYDEAEIDGERARVKVTLIGARASVAYEFLLRRQRDAPYIDCWMTDGVGVARVEGAVAAASKAADVLTPRPADGQS